MSIDKESGKYRLYCDICGEVDDEVFYNFHDAVTHKRAAGWKSRKEAGEWLDVCPECQRLEESKWPQKNNMRVQTHTNPN